MTCKHIGYERVTIEPVKVLGEAVGNLWHVLSEGETVARVTYWGNSLVCVWGELPCPTSVIERKIQEAYDGPK